LHSKNLKENLEKYFVISDKIHKIVTLLDSKKSLKMIENSNEKNLMKQLLLSEMIKFNNEIYKVQQRL
jgi:hypothetical protein